MRVSVLSAIQTEISGCMIAVAIQTEISICMITELDSLVILTYYNVCVYVCMYMYIIINGIPCCRCSLNFQVETEIALYSRAG
jgi:hypothetical protein